jgi:HAD superfamily hydrolase (TIGR01459 family)
LSFIEITSLRDVAARYRHLYVDAYGVLYDGGAPFPGAPEALARARAAGLRVCIVTNSASRGEVVARRLAERAGLTTDHYDAIATSGELSWRYLEDQRLPIDTPLHVITEEGGPSWIADITHPVVDDVRESGAILAIGMPHLTESAFYQGNLAETLQTGASMGLPMIVADSDETYPWRGTIRLGAGWLARRYGEMGGRLIEFGKPHRPIYDFASSLLGSPARAEVLAIGDNLLTDIAGAAGYGVDSLLVLEGGVHGGSSSASLRGASGAHPTYLAPRLCW